MSAANCGRPLSTVHRETISKAMSGRTFSSEHLAKLSAAKIGDRSNLWRGGRSSETEKLSRRAEARHWSKKILSRDNHTCQHCGATDGEIHAHHVLPFCDYQEYRYDISNGVTLCNSCHGKEQRTGTARPDGFLLFAQP